MVQQKKFFLINVLSQEAFNDCQIKGSINVPVDSLESYVQNIAKDTPIVVYCASYQCPMSRKAWHILHAMGFTQVFGYEGGINEWKYAGLPTEGACKLPYLDTLVPKPPQYETDIQQMTIEELKKLLHTHGML